MIRKFQLNKEQKKLLEDLKKAYAEEDDKEIRKIHCKIVQSGNLPFIEASEKLLVEEMYIIEYLKKSSKNQCNGFFNRGSGNVAKFSPKGRLSGFYQGGQRNGNPSTLMPAEQQYKDAEKRFLKEIGKINYEVNKKEAGKRSGVVRGRTKQAAIQILATKPNLPRHTSKQLQSELEELGFKIGLRMAQIYVKNARAARKAQ